MLLLLQNLDSPITAQTPDLFSYSIADMVINTGLATVLGIVISLVYRATHKGLSYSQSFTQTILFVAVIVAIVMMVIGGSLARAFALVGALSIIRFRTVVKDTKDTAYVFASLAIGMAAGTASYQLAVIATVFISAIAFAMHVSNFGAVYKSEFILRFVFEQSKDSAEYLERIKEHAKRSNLLHIEPSGDGTRLKLTYDIQIAKEGTPERLVRALKDCAGVSEVVLIVSKNDVDY
jgi:uncharacterized membrane protein YhiD involved in acid resistance